MHALISALFATLMAYGPKTAFAHDGQATAFCETKLALESEAQAKLGYKPVFEIERLEPFQKNQGQQRYMISAKHPRFGMTLAFLDFTLSPDGKAVEIEKVDVLNENNFRRGLSNILFAQMLADRPEITQISATLSQVNRTALLTAMGREGNCVEAFVATPLYKTAVHFGFNKIAANCNPATSEYKFVITRESAH